MRTGEIDSPLLRRQQQQLSRPIEDTQMPNWGPEAHLKTKDLMWMEYRLGTTGKMHWRAVSTTAAVVVVGDLGMRMNSTLPLLSVLVEIVDTVGNAKGSSSALRRLERHDLEGRKDQKGKTETRLKPSCTKKSFFP